jgi:enamine deaminase RidA (YjgF/YER057c/UK114 family)
MHHTLRPHVRSRVKEPMLAKGLLQSRRLPNPAGIFAAGVKPPAGQLSFVSDQVTREAASDIVGQGDMFGGQTRQALKNARAILEAAGPTPDDIVKVTVFVTGVSHLSATHEGRAECFKRAYPVSPLVEFKSLVSPDRLVDIEAIAAAPA